MKTIKNILIISSLVAGTLSAAADNTASGYFLDNYDYRFQMNPAMGNEKGFVSMPMLGNFSLTANGNLHLTDIFYNRGGKTVLFLNPEVSTEEAMKKFGDRNRLGESLKLNILTIGFKALGGYNTINISAQENLEMSLPGSFFSLAKEGIGNKTYSINDLYAHANAFATVALNHSRDIKQVPGLRIGAAVKLLVGVGDVEAKLHQADLTLGKDSWSARTNADIYASLKGLKYKTSIYEPKGTRANLVPREYVSGVEMDNFSPINGYGFGLDLGATYKWKDFTFSAAMVDLNFISWSETSVASTNGTREFDTDAYIFSANGDADNSFKNEMKNLQDDAAKLYQLSDNGIENNMFRSMGATLNFGVDYAFPLYRKLHFGLMNSTRVYGEFSSTEFRLSANVAPVKWLSATANIVEGTYGFGFGWMLNIHTTGFNFFLGMDRTPGKLSNEFLPLNSNANFNFGINFPF